MALDGCIMQALDAAFEIHKKYWYLAKEVPYGTPCRYGIGIAIGEAIRVQPETFLQQMNELDFLGYPLNCERGCKAFQERLAPQSLPSGKGHGG